MVDCQYTTTSREGIEGAMYLSSLEQTKRLSKSKSGNDISSHERPPFEDISDISLGILLDLLNSKLAFSLDSALPVLTEI